MTHRIPPRLDDAGQPVELLPPTGGHWLRAADGGLSPADADTANGAGLDWPPHPEFADTTPVQE